MIGESVESPARELIQLSFPASGDLVVLARFTAATVAARAGFDIDEIEDLRLAVDELCVSLGPLGDGASVRMEFGRLDDTVTVVCTVDGPVGEGPSPGDGPNPAPGSGEQIVPTAPRRSRRGAPPRDARTATCPLG